MNQTQFPAKGKRNIKEILMDNVEINIGTPKPRGHIIQNFSENPAFKGRAFSDKGKSSGSRPQEDMSLLEEKQVVPTKLCIIEGPAKGKKFDLKEKTMFIGRSARNDIQIKDIMVSRKHLKIFKHNIQIHTLAPPRASMSFFFSASRVSPISPSSSL